MKFYNRTDIISEQRDPETRLKYIQGIGIFQAEELIIYQNTYPPNLTGHKVKILSEGAFLFSYLYILTTYSFFQYSYHVL